MALKWILVLVVMALKQAAPIEGQITGCAEREYIISLNETITPPELVQASSFLGSPFRTPRRNVLYFGQNGDNHDLHTWCTVSSDTDPYVVINFNLSVVITGFLSSGSTYSANSQNNIYHVTNFTLEYAERNSSGALNFVYYKNIINQDVKHFQQTELVELFRLDKAIIADSIRLRMVEWVHIPPVIDGNEAICQGVALFGCTASEAISVEAEQVIVRDNHVLEITLPIAIVTIIIIVTAIGVLLCVIKIKQGRSHKYEIPSNPPLELQSPKSVRIVDNSALYSAPSEIDQYGEQSAPFNTGMIKFVDNSDLYNEMAEDIAVEQTIHDSNEQTDSQTSRHTDTEVTIENLEIIYTDTEISVPNNSSNNMIVNSAYGPSLTKEANGENFQLKRNHSYDDIHT